MAEPTAQQLARQRLAQVDIAKFAPPPPKRKKSEPEPPKYTKPKVQLTAEERAAKKKAYNHDYYLSHKEEIRAKNDAFRKAHPHTYTSSSLRWYYSHREHCLEKNREWRMNNKERKVEYSREWRKKHPGYYTKEQKQKRKEKRENGARV